ncbi:hypothetical protein ES706_00676 [subsurface metagenome]|nr:transcriptional regulator [Hadesarchaea archaeon]
MAELTPLSQKVHEALKKLGATNPDALRTTDDVVRVTRLPKGMTNNALMDLIAKGYTKRVTRQKTAGYYATK